MQFNLNTKNTSVFVEASLQNLTTDTIFPKQKNLFFFFPAMFHTNPVSAYKESFDCINKLKTYCGSYGTTCEEAEVGIQCSAMKAQEQCGLNGYDYVDNIFSIGLCYTRTNCKNFCKHPTPREVRDILNGSSIPRVSISIIFINLFIILKYFIF